MMIDLLGLIFSAHESCYLFPVRTPHSQHHLHYSMISGLLQTPNLKNQSKANIPELDNTNFVDNISQSLSILLSTNSKEVKCMESIVLSSFNPPPTHRRFLRWVRIKT